MAPGSPASVVVDEGVLDVVVTISAVVAVRAFAVVVAIPAVVGGLEDRVSVVQPQTIRTTAQQNHGRNLTKPVSQKTQGTAFAYLYVGLRCRPSPPHRGGDD